MERAQKRTKRISREEAFMKIAKVMAERSTCRVPNGAILVRNNRIVASGYNGSPPGREHCIDVGCIVDTLGRCSRTIHAEINVILMAARYGISTEGATLYCTTCPCPNCSKLLSNSGIVKVVYEDLYHNLYTTNESISVLRKSNIEVVKFKTEKGPEGRSSA